MLHLDRKSIIILQKNLLSNDRLKLYINMRWFIHTANQKNSRKTCWRVTLSNILDVGVRLGARSRGFLPNGRFV
jgi:hypothetical protein